MLSRAYKRYVLAALTLVCTLNFLDRMLLILLLQPIKADLRLSDTELGFVTGIAFGLFYALLGIPVARWADWGNRVKITSMAIGLWGVTVMLYVFVGNFAQLVVARVAAAVGEAGCMPPTYSLLADYFPAPAERNRAMAIYWLANPLSSLMGFMVGGWLSRQVGWRITFLIAGIPALATAALIGLTVREPRDPTLPAGHARRPNRRPLGISDVVLTLWRQSSSRHLVLAIVALFTMALGLAPWYAAFLMRSHAMRIEEVGLWLGLGFGVAGVFGTLAGGWVAARWFVANEGGQMRLCSVAVAGLLPCLALFLLLPQKAGALMALIPMLLVFNFYLGPTFALLQRLVSDDIRATTVALLMFAANLIGMGVGPQVVGVLSDVFSLRLGADGLRYAMLSVSLLTLWSAFHFWKVAQTVQQDLCEMRRRAVSGCLC